MSKSIKEIDSSIYAKKIYELKHPNKKLYKNVQNRIAQTINETFGTVYNVVCIDIDKTLTDNVQGKEFIPESIIKSFKRIISLNCYVCFITGRGKENSKSIINELIQRCVNSKSYNMSLISRWYCITNNGVDILFTKPDDKALMEHSISLLQKEVINKFRNRKKFLRDEVATIISKHIGLKKEEIVLSSENSSGDTSLRFRMPKELERNNRMISEYENELSKLPRGKLTIKKINSHSYFYLKFRVGEQVVSKYVGKDNCDLSDLIEKLDKRKHIEEMLRQLKTEKRELEKLGGKI